MSDDNSQLLNQLIRVGKVSSIDAAKCTARVTFEDNDDLVSDDLPIITRNTLFNKDYWMPDINEQVLCLFLPIGVSQGFVLGSFYSAADLPIENSGDVTSIQFKDGSKISFDRSTGILSVEIKNQINIKSPKINFTTSEFTVDSPKSIFTGLVTAKNVQTTGNVVAAGDVSDSGGSLSAVRTAFNSHGGHYSPANSTPSAIASSPVTPSGIAPAPSNISTSTITPISPSGGNSFPARGIDAALSYAPENILTEWVTISNGISDYLSQQPLYLKRIEILNTDGELEGSLLGVSILPDQRIDLSNQTYDGYILLVTYKY